MSSRLETILGDIMPWVGVTKGMDHCIITYEDKSVRVDIGKDEYVVCNGKTVNLKYLPMVVAKLLNMNHYEVKMIDQHMKIEELNRMNRDLLLKFTQIQKQIGADTRYQIFE